MIEARYFTLIWTLFTSTSQLGWREASSNISSELKANSPTIRVSFLKHNSFVVFHIFNDESLSDGILSCNQPINIPTEVKVSEVENAMATQGVTVASTWNDDAEFKKKTHSSAFNNALMSHSPELTL